MGELLRLLAEHYSWLWGESRYRITDSRATESFGNALVVISSDALRIRVARDRGQFLWDFQSPDGGERDWYDLDVIWRFLTGESIATVLEPPERVAHFVQDHLSQIEALFGSDERAQTTTALEDLQRVRAKELFG
jgi:hypothetical protein